MNSISAVGRIGKDATTRVAGQTNVASFSMAVETSKKDDQGKFIVDWFKVDVWGKQGDSLLQYLKQGTQVFVNGRLEIEKYNNAQNVQVTQPTINAQHVKLLQRPQGQQQAPAAVAKPAAPPVAAPSQTDYDAIFGDSEAIPF